MKEGGFPSLNIFYVQHYFFFGSDTCFRQSASHSHDQTMKCAQDIVKSGNAAYQSCD